MPDSLCLLCFVLTHMFLGLCARTELFLLIFVIVDKKFVELAVLIVTNHKLFNFCRSSKSFITIILNF